MVSLNRRQFIVGTASAAAAVALPGMVYAGPKWYEVQESFFANQSYPKDHPEYNKIETYMLHSLRVRYAEEVISWDESMPLSPFTLPNTRRVSNKMNLQIIADVFSPETAYEVESLGHAEHLFLNMWTPEDHVYKLNERKELLAIRINQAASRIAMRTRRMWGNNVIYHPNNEHLMTLTRQDGRYKLWPTKNCPRDKIRILGKGNGEADSGYIFGQTGLKSYLWEMKNREGCLSNAFDYIETVKLENI